MSSLIIAHRGASALAKHENTIEAFSVAIELGCDYAEFDIRRTLDGTLIVFHDPEYKGIPLRSITYTELNRRTGKDGFSVPKLAEVLALCKGRIKLDIELKETGYEKEVLSVIKRYLDYEDYQIKSFLDTAVYRIKHLDKRVCTGLLLGFRHGDPKRRFNEYYPSRRLLMCRADFVSPNHRLATRDFLSRMHRQGFKVYVWTVNKPEAILHMLRNGADGVITDRPDLALQLKSRKDMIK